MEDPTEDVRRELTQVVNEVEGSREYLESVHGQVWDTSELQADFSVEGFLAPFVTVTRKSDKAKGALTFQHSPRFYFDFTILT